MSTDQPFVCPECRELGKNWNHPCRHWKLYDKPKPSVDRETWRFMEQFSNIALCGSVWSGNLISKSDTSELIRRKLVRWSNKRGGYVLAWRGRLLWWLWNK